MIARSPAFFDDAPSITLRDALSRFLGASRDGVIEYRYEDVVALAGHSCPTVSAAFLMTRAALKALYPDSLPERGNIKVEWRDAKHEGVTGVMANVALLITGAADEGGFHGIGGNFQRSDLLHFNAPIEYDARFTRTDTGANVQVSADLSQVPMDPRVRLLMPKCLAGGATLDEQTTFGEAWQSRVKTLLLDHADDPAVILLHQGA